MDIESICDKEYMFPLTRTRVDTPFLDAEEGVTYVMNPYMILRLHNILSDVRYPEIMDSIKTLLPWGKLSNFDNLNQCQLTFEKILEKVDKDELVCLFEWEDIYTDSTNLKLLKMFTNVKFALCDRGSLPPLIAVKFDGGEGFMSSIK